VLEPKILPKNTQPASVNMDTRLECARLRLGTVEIWGWVMQSEIGYGLSQRHLTTSQNEDTWCQEIRDFHPKSNTWLVWENIPNKIQPNE